MKFTKIISIILAVLILAGVFVSCADSPDDTAVHTKAPGDNGSDEGEWLKKDYGGEPFTFLFIKHSDIGKDYYGGEYLDAESYTGDTISDAVYARNLAVEEKYAVDIDQLVEISGDPGALLQEYYMAGDYRFDVVYGWAYKLGRCITENYFADFNDLPTVDFTAEYWCPSAKGDLEVDGHLYLCMNDITMNKLQWAGFYFYNKQLFEDYNLEAEFGNIYDLVRDGKWTLDTFLSLISSVTTDLDGNGVIGKDDVYGLLDGDNTGSGCATSSGITLTAKNDDGSLYLSLYSEKLLDIIGKVNPVFSNTDYVKAYSHIWDEGGTEGNGAYSDQWEYARSFFVTDHALFCAGSAYETSEFRNMEHAYGIVPCPKYDEIQEDYYTTVSCLASTFALPATVRQVGATNASMERTSVILDYMAYKSNEILLPVYYDTLIKGQRLDSDDDSQMLDIIRDSIHFDLAETVGLEDITAIMYTMFRKPTTATSTYKRQEKKLQKLLDDFYSEVVELSLKNAENAE